MAGADTSFIYTWPTCPKSGSNSFGGQLLVHIQEQINRLKSKATLCTGCTYYLFFISVTPPRGGCINQLTGCCYFHGEKEWIWTLVRVLWLLFLLSRECRPLFIFNRKRVCCAVLDLCQHKHIICGADDIYAADGAWLCLKYHWSFTIRIWFYREYTID